MPFVTAPCRSSLRDAVRSRDLALRHIPARPLRGAACPSGSGSAVCPRLAAATGTRGRRPRRLLFRRGWRRVRKRPVCATRAEDAQAWTDAEHAGRRDEASGQTRAAAEPGHCSGRCRGNPVRARCRICLRDRCRARCAKRVCGFSPVAGQGDAAQHRVPPWGGHPALRFAVPQPASGLSCSFPARRPGGGARC